MLQRYTSSPQDIEARLEDRVEEEEDFEEFFAGVLKEAKEQEQALVQQQCNTYQVPDHATPYIAMHQNTIQCNIIKYNAI